MKDLILKMALESGKDRFRLLASMNSTPWIFMWCDEESNFVGMCNNGRYKNCDYTFDELDKVIDNAEDWLNTVRNMQSSKNISNLYVMAI